jgi:hypothetical protein
LEESFGLLVLKGVQRISEILMHHGAKGQNRITNFHMTMAMGAGGTLTGIGARIQYLLE